MKRIFTILIVLTLLFSLCSCDKQHYDENNISDLYDEQWIVGKSIEVVKQKYGEFERVSSSNDGKTYCEYYVNYDNEWSLGLPPSYIHDTYTIVFNNDNIAIETFFSETSLGG